MTSASASSTLAAATTVPEVDASAQEFTPRAHEVDYRTSINLMGTRVYLVLLAGTETRSKERLQKDGQIRPLPTITANLTFLVLTLSSLACMLVGLVVIALFVARHMLGIELP